MQNITLTCSTTILKSNIFKILYKYKIIDRQKITCGTFKILCDRHQHKYLCHLNDHLRHFKKNLVKNVQIKRRRSLFDI